MSIPTQLQEQKDIVAAHYAKLSEDKPGDGDAQPTPAAPTETTPEPAAASSTETAPAPSEDYEHRFSVIQGKYNTEVPRLHQTIREQTARLQSLEQLIATMQAAPPQTQQAPAQSLVTEEDKNAYGDSIDVMRRVCREEIGDLSSRVVSLTQLIQQLQASVVPRVNEVAQRQARSADEQFWATLNALVPNWQTINDDERFKSWLLEQDPLAGTTRQTLLEVAHGNLDARRVASFFNTWTSLNGGAGASKPAGKKQAVSELESQVSPGRGRSAAPPAPNTPKQITREDVSKFYDDVRKGVYKGREEERARLERDIFVAMKEGRVG